MIDATRLGFAPFISDTLLYSLIAVSVVVWLIYIFRRGRAWLTRGLGLSLLALALSNPALVTEEREPLTSIAALVVDRSESMSFGERTAIADAAFEQLRAQLEADESLDLRIVETDPGANGTNLHTALQQAFSDAPRDRIAGAILLTDGQVHDLPEDLSSADQIGPVHSLIIGDPDAGDRRIEIVNAPNFGIVGEMANLEVRVSDPASPIVPLDISINGDIPFRVTAIANEVTSIPIEIERRGPNMVVIQTPEGTQELTLANNRTAQVISGVRDRLRVLLVTGEPHQGARVWRDLLKSDPSVDLVHFTILRPPHKQDGTPTNELALIAFPTRELFDEKLEEFDLIIFDRYRRRGVLQVTYFDNMARYVDNGGALLIVAGEPFAGPASLHRTPLAAVLPVRPTGTISTEPFKPQLSELGKRHSVTSAIEGESWGEWHRFVGSRQVTGDALMEAEDGSPLLVLDRVGDGRVAELLSDQLWLWARGHDGGGPFSELVRRLVHWLMKEPELEEERLDMAIDDNQAKLRLRTLQETPPPITLETPEGDIVNLEWTESTPGNYVAEQPVDQLGLYRAISGLQETVALNGPANPIEYLDLRSSETMLAPFTAASNGSIRRLGTVGDLNLPDVRRVADRARSSGGDWIGFRERNAYAVRSSESQPILPGILAVAVLLAFLMLAWRREGR